MSKLVVLTESELDNKMSTTFFRCLNHLLKRHPHLFKDSSQSHTSKSDTDELYLSKKEAAKLASVGVSTIDFWIRRGHIKKYKFGGSVRINKSNLLAYLESKAV